MDVICPVTIRLKDVRSEIISICPSHITATKYKLAISTSNPLDEDGPLLEGGMVDAEPAGPDRIHVDIQDPAMQPCFIAIPKVLLPFTGGYTLELDPAVSVVTTAALPNVAPDSLANTWFQTIKYGVNHLDNFSIHAKDTLFVYEGLEKGDFIAANRNLASRCTVRVTTLTYDDPIYHEVIRNIRNEKEKANLSFGSKLLATTAMPSASTCHQTPPTINLMVTTPTAPLDAYKELISEFTKAITDSTGKSVTATERERANEAADVTLLYQLLFASSRDVIQDDGTTVESLVPATIHSLFAPILTANKNSKATKFLQDAVEHKIAELGSLDDKFASAANLYPKMFDQPLTAALRTGQWENTLSVLHPEGIKIHFGLHHLAPPRTNSAVYKARQVGETLLIQQEQVDEDKSRLNAKTTDLYYMDCMTGYPDLNETVANFLGMMNVIIVFDPASPPILWNEIAKFDRILRSPEGRQWCKLHRYVKEVLFNVLQDIQTTIAYFKGSAQASLQKARVIRDSHDHCNF